MGKAVFYHPPIINIPLLTIPLAYLHLATPLKSTKHMLELVDGRLEKEPIDVLLHALTDADLMLVSSMPGSQITTGLEACAAAREMYPDLPIFWGGPHPSVDPEITIASPFVSGVMIGRGEFTIDRLIDCHANLESLAGIPNILFKDRAGNICRSPRRSFSRYKPNPPDFTLLKDVSPYLCQTRKSRRMIDYISSFGCPHRCTFCSEPVTSGSQWSCLDASELVAAMECLIDLYGIDGVLFEDAKFVTDKKRLIQFCSLIIQRRLNINWMATMVSTDVHRFEEEGILQLMHDSGCEQVFIGAEAASGETLQKYKKTVEGEETYRIAELLWTKYDILPHFSYIIGYPMETMEQVEQTLRLHRGICELIGAPTGEIGLYNPVVGTTFATENAHHFYMPTRLDEWAKYNYLKQDLYREPSAELDGMLFRHHIRIRRMFPDVKIHGSYDVWQESTLAL